MNKFCKYVACISRYQYIESVVIFALLVVLLWSRLYRLDALPLGTSTDEAAMSYNTICIVENGTDRYGNEYPIYPQNYDGGQSPLYTYLCTLLFGMFGYSLFAARVPAVLFNVVAFIFGLLIIKEINNQWFSKLMVAVLTVFSPYYIFISRHGLDCNLAVGASFAVVYFTIMALKRGKIKWHILAGVSAGILLYTYAITYVVLPIFLLMVLVYSVIIKRFSFSNWIALALPLGFLATPLIMEQLVNIFDLGSLKFFFFTTTKMDVYRSGDLFHYSRANIINVFKVLIKEGYIDELRYWHFPKITVVGFVAGIIFCVAQLVSSVHKKEFKSSSVIVFWLFAALLIAFGIEQTYNRVNTVVAGYTIVSVLGFQFAYDTLKKLVLNKRVMSACFEIAVLLVLTIQGISFFKYYFGGEFEKDYPLNPYFHLVISDGIDFVESDPILSQKVTQTASNGDVGYVISTRRKLDEYNPYPVSVGLWNNWWFGVLGEIDKSYNYLVEFKYPTFMEQLREAGFEEKEFDYYSVFYTYEE